MRCLGHTEETTSMTFTCTLLHVDLLLATGKFDLHLLQGFA